MATAREDLSARILPRITLSTDSPDSLTAPPPPLSQQLSPAARAAERFRITGNAIVTGGAGDLGFTACRALLEHGLRGLMIFDMSPEIAEAKAKQLQNEFPEAVIRFRKVNVADEEGLDAAVEETVKALGTVDVLLCFAGVVSCTHALETDVSEWRRVMDINTTGDFICAQAVTKRMAAQGTGGSIIFVASVSGHKVNFPQPQVAYNTSKAAVIAMTKSLAAEWARYGVRVNTISPGYMDTILNEGDDLDEAKKTWFARHPMGRMGKPQELTGVLVLLASRAGSYITGTDFLIDGGQTLFL